MCIYSHRERRQGRSAHVRYRLILRLFALFLSLFISTICQAQAPVSLTPSMAGVGTGMHVFYLEDPSRSYTLEQVQSEPLASRFAPLPGNSACPSIWTVRALPMPLWRWAVRPPK